MQVATASDPGEAAVIQGMLESRGIDSMVQSTGIDGPTVGYGLAFRGRRQVLVRAEDAEAARIALAAAQGATPAEDAPDESELANARNLGEVAGRGPRNYSPVGGYARALFWSLVSFAVFAALFFCIRAL